jgi:DNA-binding transcriptional ArsR family regulator
MTGINRCHNLYALPRIYWLGHIKRMETTWAALADPKRRALLDLIRQQPRSVNELVDLLALSQPTASKHLRVLRAAGLVRVERAAQRRIYTVEPAPLSELDAWLAPYRELWNERLDALGRHLDATAKTRRRRGKPKP